MLRLRQDLNLLVKEDVEVREEVDSREEIERLEELRLNGTIEGYVVKRSQYNLLSGKHVDTRSDCRKDHQNARTLYPSSQWIHAHCWTCWFSKAASGAHS